MSDNNRTITIVGSHYPPHAGGVERYVSLQAQECARLGFSVEIITHDTEHLGFVEERPGIRIYRLKCWSLLPYNRLPLPVSVRQLHRLFRRAFLRPSELTIVHTRYYALSVIGCLMARCTGGKLALFDHSSDYIRLGARWLNGVAHVYEHLLTLVILVFRPRVFGVSQACARWLYRFGIRGAGVCYNGIDLQQKQHPIIPLNELIGPLPCQKIVLAVGRLVKEKGVMELVVGFLNFAQRRDDYALVIIGHGELEPQLRAVARENPKVVFLGRQPLPSVMSCMEQAWALVNPSNYPEGLPTILLEAGLCGLAVISTPNGGAAEIIEQGETGILIDRGEPPQIEQALRTLDQTRGLRDKIARNLRERIERDFSFSKITARFLFQDMRLDPCSESSSD